MLEDHIARIKASFPEFKKIPDAQFKKKEGGGRYSKKENFVVIENEKGEELYFIKIHNKKEYNEKEYNKNKTEALRNYLHHHTFPQKTPNTQFVEDTEGFIYVSEHLKNSEEKKIKKEINISPLYFMNHTNLDRDTEIRRAACNKFVFGNSDIKSDNSIALEYPNKKPKAYDIDVMTTDNNSHTSVKDLNTYTLKEICSGIADFNVFLKELDATTDEKEMDPARRTRHPESI